MRLLPCGTIGVPDNALALCRSVWQACRDDASSVSLILLGQQGRDPLVAIAARRRALEEMVADLVAAATGTTALPSIDEETTLSDLALADHAAAWHLIPRPADQRHMDPGFHGSRFDPLGQVYPRLQRLEAGVIAGAGVVLSPRRIGRRSRLTLTSFGVASSHHQARASAQLLADAYAGAGARTYISTAPRNSIDDVLRARLRWWRSRLRPLEDVAAIWHPPYDLRPMGAQRTA